MGKFGWDLPPGVTHRQIEEAYSGDQQAEAFCDAFYKEAEKIAAERGVPLFDPETIDQLSTFAWTQVNEAYANGYAQGMADEGYVQEELRADNAKNIEG